MKYLSIPVQGCSGNLEQGSWPGVEPMGGGGGGGRFTCFRVEGQSARERARERERERESESERGRERKKKQDKKRNTERTKYSNSKRNRTSRGEFARAGWHLMQMP